MPLLYTAWNVAAFALGAVLGSFAALAVHRIPDDLGLASPPSRCPVCHTPVAWYDNVPILSWLALRARCRHCDAPIAVSYPLIETTGGLLGWLLYRRFVPAPSALDAAHLAAFAVFLLFATLLLIAALTDVRARIIPEIASLWAIPVGIGGAVLLDLLGYDGWLSIGWRSSVLGVAVAGGLIGAVSIGWYWATGREGLAWGDVRLIAMIGAFLGALPGALTVVLVASFLGGLLGIVALIASRRSVYLPFGPALALSAIAYVLYGEWIVRALLPGLSVWL